MWHHLPVFIVVFLAVLGCTALAYYEIREIERSKHALSREIDRLRERILEIAEHRPMSAMTRRALRNLANDPQDSASREQEQT